MIKLFKVKEKQKELAETAAGEPPVKKQTAGHLRLIRVLQWHEMEDSKLKPSEDSPLLSCSRLADSVDSCYSLSLSYFPHIKDLMPQYPPFDSLSEACVKLYFDLAGDISELNLPKRCTIKFPNGQDDVMHFEVTICPDEGYYENGAFVFSFQASPLYPHEPPKVKCKTKVYHPNIDLEGNVCLNILREDWKPVLNVNTIIYGLYHLFTEPNHEDPLNYEAAAVLRENPKLFESNVRRAVSGDLVDGTRYPSAYCPYTDEE